MSHAMPAHNCTLALCVLLLLRCVFLQHPLQTRMRLEQLCLMKLIEWKPQGAAGTPVKLWLRARPERRGSYGSGARPAPIKHKHNRNQHLN